MPGTGAPPGKGWICFVRAKIFYLKNLKVPGFFKTFQGGADHDGGSRNCFFREPPGGTAFPGEAMKPVVFAGTGFPEVAPKRGELEIPKEKFKLIKLF